MQRSINDAGRQTTGAGDGDGVAYQGDQIARAVEQPPVVRGHGGQVPFGMPQ